MLGLRAVGARATTAIGRRACRSDLVAKRMTTAAGAKPGDFVSVEYTGTLESGEVFDTSRKEGRGPLEFVVGGGRMIKGFDRAVTGLEVGQSRKVAVPPAEAYGERSPDMVVKVPAGQAPPGMKAGDMVRLSNGMTATVVAVDDKDVTIDANHELAGKTLHFDVELTACVPKERVQVATFGMGCFWGPELRYARLPGVLSTEVGYCNGRLPDPSYEDVCSGETGHAEVVRVQFDPSSVTYAQLLDVFFDGHDPTTLNRQKGDVGTQYRSGIYCEDEAQKAAAEKALAAAQAKFGNKIVTEVTQIKMYYPAEPYHQQYLARGGRNGNAQNPAKGCTDPIRCYG